MENLNQLPQDTLFKPRRPIIALLFSLFTPGLGQIYNGQFLKGIIFYLLCLLFPLLFGLMRVATNIYGFIATIVIGIVLGVYIIIDAIINAKRQKKFKPKKYNKWPYYILYPKFGMKLRREIKIKFVTLRPKDEKNFINRKTKKG